MYKQIKEIYHKYNLSYYIALVASFIVGTFNIIYLLFSFSFTYLFYALFCYLMCLARFLLHTLNKHNKAKYIFLLASLLALLILLPLVATMVLTLLYKDDPSFIYEWLIYAYALYASIKMYFAIRNIYKYKNTQIVSLYFISLINALYTIFVLEFF